MKCPCLKIIVELIKAYSTYDSNALIAKQIGITEATLRGYWDRDKVGIASIPDKNVDAFCELLMHIVPRPLSKDSARQLLQGNAIAFHNALLPVGGRSWQTLIDTFQATTTLAVTVKPEINLGFGEPNDEDSITPDATVPFNRPFFFTGKAPWRGEAAIIAEHLGEWHICTVAQGQRIAPLEGHFSMPPKSIAALTERTKPGIYRYFVIAVEGRMPDLLREQLYTANPPEQFRLDMLADSFMDSGKNKCLVWGTTIRVE